MIRFCRAHKSTILPVGRLARVDQSPQSRSFSHQAPVGRLTQVDQSPLLISREMMNYMLTRSKSGFDVNGVFFKTIKGACAYLRTKEIGVLTIENIIPRSIPKARELVMLNCTISLFKYEGGMVTYDHCTIKSHVKRDPRIVIVHLLNTTITNLKYLAGTYIASIEFCDGFTSLSHLKGIPMVTFTCMDLTEFDDFNCLNPSELILQSCLMKEHVNVAQHLIVRNPIGLKALYAPRVKNLQLHECHELTDVVCPEATVYTATKCPIISRVKTGSLFFGRPNYNN